MYCTSTVLRCARPPLALLRLTKLPHVCLLHWLRGMRFDERHPGLLHIEGGIAIAARLRCALQRNEVQRKFDVGRGGTAPVPHRIINTARVRRLALSRLGLDRLALALRRSLSGKAIMADALHWVVAVRIGFTTESVQSTTEFSATFVAVRVLGGAGWNQTQFPCCTGHRACPLCSLCARGVCSRSSNNSSRDVILLRIPRSKAAPERGFVLMWRRKWAVDRAVAALFASSAVSSSFRQHYLEQPPYSDRLIQAIGPPTVRAITPQMGREGILRTYLRPCVV